MTERPDPSPLWIIAMLAVAVALWAVLLSLAFGRPAHGHSAPSGWEYPTDCCSGRDCFPIPEAELEATPVGWRVRATGETLDYHDRNVRPSGDGRFHRCSQDGKPEGRTLCLFIPARS